MGKGCPGCGPVPWGSFSLWVHGTTMGPPCPYRPLKITTSVGALVNFFLKLGFSGKCSRQFFEKCFSALC